MKRAAEGEEIKVGFLKKLLERAEMEIRERMVDYVRFLLKRR